MADVTQTDDADHPLALVHHRQPAELQLLHVMDRLCEVIVLPATMDAFGHHIPRHRAASIEVVARKPFADDVAVGHHPYQSVVLPNRNAADVMPPHQFREFGDRGVGADPVDTLVHYVFDFHGGPPYLVSGAFASMQHSPHFLNYTTDRVRRHQRLKVAEEIIIPALLRDRTRQTPSPSPSRTVDSDFATRGSRPTSDAGGLFPNNICPATDTTDIPSVVRAKTPMPCVGRQSGKLRVTEMKQRLVIAGFHIDLRLCLDAIVDDEIQAVAFADGRNCTVRAVAEQPIDLGFIGHVDIVTE